MSFVGLFSLEGKVALVTGGSRGIGRIIASAFVQQGAKVYISSRKAAACDETASELGPNCIALPMDISTVEGCEALAQQIMALERQLDILVNNAGAAWATPFEEFSEVGWDKVMSLNLKSPFFLTQALHPLLARDLGGDARSKVINITSIDGVRLNPWETYSYHASKAGLIHLTRRMAARLISDGIIVTSLAPGAFASEMNRAARDHGDAIAGSIPQRRIGNFDDMAGPAIFLASRASDYVVGSTLFVDGGVVNASLGTELD
jgi:NAD(P)-dependent dehydrogenase (short-subunit alcohol dehydrogenase family)